MFFPKGKGDRSETAGKPFLSLFSPRILKNAYLSVHNQKYVSLPYQKEKAMKNLTRKIGILSVIMAGLLIVLPAAAKITYGVRVGGGYSSLVQKVGGESESGARFGFSLAGLADIPLRGRWSIRPEIAFANQGGAYYSGPGMDGMALHNKCWYYSLQIPVNVAYTFVFTDVSLSIFAGPAFDWSLFGKMKSREIDPDIHFGVSDEKDLKPCDLGVNVGLGVEYNHFFFSIGALCGTIDRRAVKREGETSVYQNNVTLSLGYYFR